MPGKEKKRPRTPKITPYRGKEENKQEEKREKKVQKIIPFEGKAKKKEEKEEKQETKVQRIIPFEGKANKEEEKEEKLIPFEGKAKKEEEKEEKLFPFEGKAKKEEEKEEKQGKKVQRIIPFDGKAEKEEKKETLATLFGERMLGSMLSDEVGVATTAPAPLRCWPTDGPTGGSFAPSSGQRAPRRHGATRVFFSTTIPPTMTSKGVTPDGGTHE